jgi:Uma2 family endonuclease
MRSARPILPETMADLLQELGDISPRRVRLQPLPGIATEKDLLDILHRSDRLYELVDGILVEKVMCYWESSLTMRLVFLLQQFLDRQDLGNLAGPDGPMRLMPRLVRIPDISFVRWENLPHRALPTAPIPDLVPDLAVEVLSEGNTPAEMQRKLKEYFLAGVKLVWFVEPDQRTVRVFAAPDRSVTLTADDTLDGGDVLPGFTLPVKQVFAKLPRQQNGRRPPRRRTPSGKRGKKGTS